MKKKINPQAMQIAACLHDWLEHHVPSIKACSRHTLRNYHVSMTLYAEFLRSTAVRNSVLTNIGLLMYFCV